MGPGRACECKTVHPGKRAPHRAASASVQCVSCRQTTFPCSTAFKIMARLTVATLELGLTSQRTFHVMIGAWLVVLLRRRAPMVSRSYSPASISQDVADGGAVPWTTVQSVCQERIWGISRSGRLCPKDLRRCARAEAHAGCLRDGTMSRRGGRPKASQREAMGLSGMCGPPGPRWQCTEVFGGRRV